MMQEDIKPPKKSERSVSEQTRDEPQPQGENIFIANPEPPKAAKSNTIAWEIIMAAVALILIIAGAAVWSHTAANSAAVRYESNARGQLIKMGDYLQLLNPSVVINNSDIEASVEGIASLKQSRLENVIFGALLSERYKDADQAKRGVDDYYNELQTAANDLTALNKSRSEIRIILNNIKDAQVEETEDGVVARPQNTDSLRSLSGTLKSSAQRVKDLEAPQQLESIRKQIIDEFDVQAKVYADWASAIEEKKNGEISKIQKTIEKSNEKLIELTSDENYTKQFEPTYKKLVRQHERLTELLS